MGFQDPLVGGIALRKPAIRSSNYVAGSTGWTVNVDGSAEFNNVTIRGGATVGGTALFYNGTPALGNLVASIAAAAGSDSFGNHYGAGILAYDDTNGLFAQVNNAQVLLGAWSAGTGPDTAHAGLIAGGATAGVSVESGISGSLTDRGVLQLNPGQPNKATGSNLNPFLKIIDSAGNSAVDLIISGSVIQADDTGATRTWQAPTFGANWSAATMFDGLGGGEGLRSHLMPDDSVWHYGLATTAAGATSTIATLAAGYYSTVKTTYGTALRNVGGTVTPVGVAISTAGTMFSTTTPAAGDEYLINFRVPLENVP
jgi:hypothetical protein